MFVSCWWAFCLVVGLAELVAGIRISRSTIKQDFDYKQMSLDECVQAARSKDQLALRRVIDFNNNPVVGNISEAQMENIAEKLDPKFLLTRYFDTQPLNTRDDEERFFWNTLKTEKNEVEACKKLESAKLLKWFLHTQAFNSPEQGKRFQKSLEIVSNRIIPFFDGVQLYLAKTPSNRPINPQLIKQLLDSSDGVAIVHSFYEQLFGYERNPEDYAERRDRLSQIVNSFLETMKTLADQMKFEQVFNFDFPNSVPGQVKVARCKFLTKVLDSQVTAGNFKDAETIEKKINKRGCTEFDIFTLLFIFRFRKTPEFTRMNQLLEEVKKSRK